MVQLKQLVDMCNDFFILTEKDTKGAMNVLLNCADSNTLDIFHNIVNISTPIKATKFGGNRCYDLINASNGLFLVHNRIIDVFEKNSIRGWGTIPVIIQGKSSTYCYDYSLLTINSKLVQLNKDCSIPFNQNTNNIPINARSIKIGFSIDISTWDGSDIFSANNTFYVIITNKVRELLIKNKVTNCDIININDVEVF